MPTPAQRTARAALDAARPAVARLDASRGSEDLHPADILFIRSDGVYTEIVTLNETLVQRKLLKDIAQELPASFIRVHRSYIVNSDYIEQRSPATLIVRGNEIPISRSFRKNLD